MLRFGIDNVALLGNSAGENVLASSVDASKDLQRASNNFLDSSAPNPPTVIAFTRDFILDSIRGTCTEDLISKS